MAEVGNASFDASTTWSLLSVTLANGPTESHSNGGEEPNYLIACHVLDSKDGRPLA